jgi:hypothetical protein
MSLSDRKIIRRNARWLLRLTAFRTVFVVASIFLLVPIVSADEIEVITQSSIENIGFVKSPPLELKEKFPMCDAFLKVTWIDKEKKIGYTEYDLYKSNEINGEWRNLALVHLDSNWPNFRYDIEAWRNKNELEKLSALIINGDIKTTIGEYALTISGEDGASITVPSTSLESTLSNNKLNVCIPFPDGKRMWIAEEKKIYKVYEKQEINKKMEKLKPWIPDIFPVGAYLLGSNSSVIDINFDGIEDYFGSAVTVYSSENRYYRMQPMWAQEYDHNYGEFYFPQIKKTCQVVYWTFYLTTDGRNFFLNNQCNLTKLTQKGEWNGKH